MKSQYRSGWWIILTAMVCLFLFYQEQGMVVKSYFEPAVNIMNSKEREHLEEGMHVQMEIFYLEDPYETVRNGKNRLVSKTYMVPYMVKKDGEYIPTAMLSVLSNRFNYFDKTLEYCSKNNYQWVRQKAKPEYILQVDGYLKKMTAYEKKLLKEKHLRHKSEEEAEEIIVPYVVCDYHTQKGTIIMFALLTMFIIFMIVREIYIQWIRRKPLHLQVEKYINDNYKRVRDNTNVISYTKKDKKTTVGACMFLGLPMCLLMLGAVGQPAVAKIIVHIFLLPLILPMAANILLVVFNKYTYIEKKDLLVHQKLIFMVKRGYLPSATRAYVERKIIDKNQNYTQILKIYFADGTKIYFKKKDWKNMGLIYELIDKYNIPYEDNEDWKTYKDYMYGESLKTDTGKDSPEIAKKAKMKMPED